MDPQSARPRAERSQWHGIASDIIHDRGRPPATQGRLGPTLGACTKQRSESRFARFSHPSSAQSRSSTRPRRPRRVPPPSLSHANPGLTQEEHMFYSIDKRPTGGWCGPGQCFSPSAVCQPTSAGQVSGQLPAVLAPASASVDQGPGASLLPIAYCLLPRKRVSRSIPPTQPKRTSFHFSNRVPFSSYPLHLTAESDRHFVDWYDRHIVLSPGGALLCEPMVSTWGNLADAHAGESCRIPPWMAMVW